MNKMYEYLSQNPDKKISIKQSSDFQNNRMNDRERANKYFEYKNFYDIHEYDYLVDDNDSCDLIKFLNDNNIENDGGYLFAGAIRIVYKTNKVYDRIIRKKFNIIC